MPVAWSNECPYITGVETVTQEQRQLDRSGGPLWAALLADLRERLAAGEFDDAFPGELALVEQYGVSRHTVREALRHLRAEGTVTAARGRKPRLAPAEVEQQLGAMSSLFAAVEAAGLEQRSVVRALQVRADGVIATRMRLEESTPLVYLERLRLAGDEPLALDRVWLPAELASPLLDVDFTHTALYTELLRSCLPGEGRPPRPRPRRTRACVRQLPCSSACVCGGR